MGESTTRPKSIGKENISPSSPYVIAEIGTNHNRDIDTARELIDVTAEAGADAVKFQIYHSEDIVTEQISVDEYGFDEYYDVDTALEAYENHLRTPREWFPTLFDYAAERGLDTVATVHCPDCASFMVGAGVDILKIASMDLTHRPLLSHLSEYELPLILSTGMGTLAEIDEAVTTLRGGNLEWLALLHCVSDYPADPADLDLRNVSMLETAFNLPVGFSDHTLSPWTAGLAVAHGACIIEKHITLDSTQSGPDHTFALEPDGLAKLVEAVEMASLSRGSRKRTPSDAAKREQYRRSIVADREIYAGEEVSSEDVRFARPGTGIEPGAIDILLGKTASRNISVGATITWEDIC